MPTVTMPQLGEGVEEGTIGKWLKKEGDHVATGEPIVEIITDKVNAEVPSPFEGTLTRILVAEGEIVHNDAGLAEVEASDGAATAERASEAAADPTDAVAEPEPVAVAEPEPVAVADLVAPTVSAAAPGGDGSWSASEAVTMPVEPETSTPVGTPVAPVAPFTGRLTPAVRRLAREHAVDLSIVPGTGLGGRMSRVRMSSGPSPRVPPGAPRADTALCRLPLPRSSPGHLPPPRHPLPRPRRRHSPPRQDRRSHRATRSSGPHRCARPSPRR